MTTRLRIGGVSATGTPRLRIGGVSADGSAPATGRLRIGGVSATGTVAVVISPIAPQTVEPMVPVTVTAVLAAGSIAPDSYVWRVVSPIGLGVTTVGNVATFTAPSFWPIPTPDPVVIGVRGKVGTALHAEVLATINVRPQTEFSRVYAGQWAGAGLTASV